MAFDINTKANISFKQIKAKAHTSNNRDPVNEPFVTRPLITNRDIWAQSIGPGTSLAQALSDGIIGSTDRVSLQLQPISGTNDVSANYSAYTMHIAGAVPAGLSGKINPLTGVAYATGDRVTNIILEAYSNENFRPHLFQDAGKTIEVTPLDACDWTVDPVAGILVQETDVAGSMRNFTSGVFDCFVYVGDTAASATATAGSTSLDLAYEQGKIINVDAGDVELRLTGTDGLKIASSDGTDAYFTASSSLVDVDVDLKVNGIKDEFVTTAIPFSQTGNTGLTGFTATSLIGAINELKTNGSDLVTDLADTTDGSAGADMIGVTGITGVLPEGGTVGSSATLQAMLEGLAKSAGGVKTYANTSAFTADKAAASYLPVDTMVFLKDINRFAIVKVAGTDVVEGTDWDYLWDASNPMSGVEFTVDATGAVSISSDAGFSLSDDSGAQVVASSTGKVDIDSADGQMIDISSDTEVQIDGTIVDVNGTTITIDGQLTATGIVGDDMIIQTTGDGQVQLKAADEIDLTGGNIDINAGDGKTVTIDSNTEVEINGAIVDVNATTATIDATDIQTTGALVQTGATHIVGDLDMDGSVDMDGASASFTTSAGFEVVATGDVDISGDTIDLTASGASIGLNTDGKVSVSAATGQLVDIASNTEVQINGGALVDIDATSITVDGEMVVTGAVQDDFIVNTTGTTGAILLNSEAQVDLNAPLIDIHGNVAIASSKTLSVDKISITSVDPTDAATITGQRTGIPFTGNLLANPGFEAGSGADADSWTEGSYSGRDASEKYYDNYSYGYEKSSEVGGVVPVLTQAVTGLALSNHVVSIWFKGTAQSDVQVVVNGSSPVTLIPAATVAAAWTRFYADVVPTTANGDFIIQVNGVAADNNKFYIDALQLEAKAATSEPTDYFSTYQSELILRIGNNAEDKISFQSQAPEGGTIKELMAIDNSQVRVYGDLIVDGSTTTINSATLTVEDNFVLLNSGLTGNPDTTMPDAKAGIEVERGDEPNTAIKWNETTNKWELTNDGSTYNTIVTASGAGSLSMDVAYDGGSSVAVDDTNVAFTMADGKSFVLADGTNTSKFVVTAGSSADSVKIDTTGGVDIDVDGGFRIDDDSGSFFDIKSDGIVEIHSVSALTTSSSSVEISANSTSILSGTTDNNSLIITASSGGIDINAAATKPITMDSGSFSIDAVLDSNVSVTDADLTLSTITSGDLLLTSADALTASADSVGVTANTDGHITLTTSGTGEIKLVSAVEVDMAAALDLNGNFDQTGNYTFKVDTTATGADAVRINSAGGVDIDAASTVAVNATNINTTGSLLQTGAMQVVGDMNLDGSIDADGEDIDLTSTGTGGTHLKLVSADAASITSVGLVLEAGAGAFTAQADLASTINVTGNSLTLSTTTSGALALDSASALTLKDSILTAALPLAQTNAAALATQFAYTSQTDFDWTVRETGTAAITSVVGALNANRQDLYEYVELVSTQGAAVGTAAGANLIGCDGISGVTPTGKSLGSDSTLQEMLEGISAGAGGGKTFADIAAFTAAKAGGTYFKSNEPVFILDTNRLVVVKTSTTAIIEGTDWDYMWSVARPLAGPAFVVESSSVDVDSAGTVSIDGATGVSILSAAASSFTTTAANLTLSTATSGNVVINAATTVDIDGASVDIDSVGAIYLTSGTGNVEIGAGANQVQLSGGEVDLTATTIDINGILDVAGASAKIDVTGAIDIDTDSGFTLDDDSGAYLALTTDGKVNVGSAIGQVIEITSDTAITLAGGVKVDLTATTLDFNGAVDMDGATFDVLTSGAFSVDGADDSNVSVTDADLTLSTITSGTLALVSAGALTLQDEFLTTGIALSETGEAALEGYTATSIVGALNEVMAAANGANTLDEIYDGQTGERVVTMDNGSVEWEMTDTYEFNVADSAGADILSVKALATGDKVDVVGKFDVTGDSTLDKTTVDGNLAQSGGTVILSSNGIMDLDATGAYTLDAAGISLDSTVASNFTVAGAKLTLSTTGAYDVEIAAGSKVDIGGATLDIDTTGAFSIDGNAASNVSVTDAGLTLSTITSGDLAIASAAALTIDSVGAFSIDGAVTASNVSVTGAALTLSTETSGNLNLRSAGELNLQDSRTSVIPFSQAGITGLPGDATSILGALKVAYENSIDIGYEEKTTNSADVTNDYIVLSAAAGTAGALLPTTTSGGPSVMRAAGYHIAAYLNGLRLSDTEWTYTYDSGSGEKRLSFVGSPITLVSGDLIMVEVRKIN